MKQILCRILLLAVVIAAIFGLSSCKIFVEQEPSTYDLIVNNFERSVVYGSELDLSGLDIEVTTAGEVKYIAVTEDMITSGGKTDSVGDHEMVIEYGGFSWSLYYEVFYKIDHIVDGSLYDSQLVMSREEYMPVKNPEKNGAVFLNWSEKVPDVLTGNLRIEAIFAEGLTLPEFTATYGDTLADLEIPEAKDGHWEWKLDPSTSVGNAGTNKFQIVFVPDNPAAEKLELTTTITVAKKKLDFTIFNGTYVYDGKPHGVEYQLSDGVKPEDLDNVVCFGTEYATEIGYYNYNLRIYDANYEGQIKGSFEIVPIKLNVSILLEDPDGAGHKDAVTIKYGESFPEYKVNILGADGKAYDISGTNLNIVVYKPDMLVAGRYEIIAKLVDSTNDGFNDLQYYDVTYSIATLTVDKQDFDPGEVMFAENYVIYYGDALSSVKFAEHPNGEWAWDYEYSGGDTVGNAGKNTFKAVFTPKDSSYNIYTAFVVLDVNKQVLEFVIDPASTNVDYDGKEHCLSYVVVDKNGKVMTGLTVTGNDKYTLANQDPKENYTITLKILDDNYTASANNVFYLHINKIDPVTDFETPLNVVWTPDITLGDIALPSDNYTWVTPANTKIAEAGIYKFKAKYTPDDTINYNVIEADMTVVVSLATTDISGVEPSYDEWTYNGNEKSLQELFKNLSVSGLNRKVEYHLNGEKVEKLTNAGIYNIKIVVFATNQYAEATFDVVVTIKRANAEVSGLGIVGWTYHEYDNSKNTPYSTANYGTVIYEYKLNSEDDSAYTETVPTEAGKYTLRARIEGGEGYNWNASEYKYYQFTVAKSIVALPTISSKVYTGAPLTADVDPHDLYEVKEGGNLGGTNVGNYPVVLVLNDADNYVWSNNAETGETSLTFVITQADNAIATFAGGSWVYGDTVSHTGITSTFGTDKITVKYYKDLGEGKRGDEVKVVTDAGNYIARAEVSGTDNYKGAFLEVPFTVAKLKIAIPELLKTSYEYTGERITAEVVDPETKYYSVNNNGGIGKNTYYVHLDLKNVNYMWEDGDENLRKSLEYSITKSLVTIDKVTISDWKFGQSASVPSVTKDKTFGEVRYEYKPAGHPDTAYTTTVPTLAGDYVVRATVLDTVNYDGTKATATFTIEKANASILGVNTNLLYTEVYNSKAYSIKGVSSSHRESAPVYTIKNELGETVNEMKNAGTYKVVITLAESANYNAAEPIEVTVVIDKFTVKVPELASYSRAYNGESFEPAVKNNGYLSYFGYSYPTDEHKNAGDYAVAFTLNDPNYQWDDEDFTGSIPYEITRINASITINTDGKGYLVANGDGSYTLTRVYTGEEFDLVSLIGATKVGEADLVYSSAKAQNVLDSGVVTLSVADSINYIGTSVTVDVVINPADITNATVTLDGALTYNGDVQTQGIASVTLGNLTVTYENVQGDKATNVVDANGKVITYTITVDGTGNFTGTAKATYNVLPMDITGAEIALGEPLTYNGQKQTQTVTSVTLGEFDVTYTVSGNEATNAITASGDLATYTLTVHGTGNFTGTKTATYGIAKRSINDAEVTLGNALTYNGKSQAQTVASVKLGELSATYSVSNNEATNVVDASGKTAKYTLTVTGTGNFEGETTQDFYVLPMNVAGATVTLGTKLTYTGEAQTQTVTSVKLGTFDVTFDVSDNVVTNAVDANGEAITYTLTITANGNFTGTLTEDFSVGKLELTKPEDNRQLKWTGEHIDLGIDGTDFYTVEDIGGTDEGDYEAFFEITDLNCKWKGESDATLRIKISYAIAKEINHWTTVPTLSKKSWTYGEDAAEINSGVAEQGTVTYKFALLGTTDYTDTLPEKPGKYVVVFTATKEGYKDLIATVEFEIKKITLINPEFEDNSLEYANGVAPQLVLKANADSDKFTFTNNAYTGVGNYSIVFTINPEYKDYYQWNENDPATISVPYSIVRADEEITDLTIDNWTYGQGASVPTATKKFNGSEIIYEYKLDVDPDTAYTTTVPTEAGDYVVRARIEGGEGYNWNGAFATKTFTIDKADASISIDVTDKDNLVANGDGTYTLTLTYTGEEFDLVSLIGATRVGEAGLVYSVEKVQNVLDSGVVTLSVAESDNYYATTLAVNVVINPADITDATITLGDALTYNGEEQTQGITSVTLGNLTVTYGNVQGDKATLAVDENGETITYTITVDGTGNFEGTASATYTVARKNIEDATINLDGALTYNGEEQTQGIASVTLGNLTVTYGNIQGDKATFAVDENGETITYTLTVYGTGNFEGTASRTYTVARKNIKDAEITLSLGNSLVYNKENRVQSITSVVIDGITMSASDYDVLASSILEATNVGNYQVTIKGKGNFEDEESTAWAITTKYLDAPLQGTVKHTYTGKEITFFDEESIFWTVTGAKTGENVNAESVPYVVTITLDPNCAWNNVDEVKEKDPIVYEYHITKGTNEFVGDLSMTLNKWTYNDTVVGEPTGIVNSTFGFDTLVYKYYDKDGNLLAGAPTDAGTYTVIAYIPGDNANDPVNGTNYGEIKTDPVTFTIDPKGVTAPAINMVQDLVKNGDNRPTLLGTTEILEEGDHGDYTVVYVDFPENGADFLMTKYYVRLELDDTNNFVWADETDESKKTQPKVLEYTLKGESAIIETTDEDGIIDGWTYGDPTAPDDINAYVVEKLGLTVSTKAGLVSEYDMYLLYFESTDPSETGITTRPTNAGTHYFKIVIVKNEEKYEQTVSEEFYQFTIEQATPEYTVPTGLTATYGYTLANVDLPAGWSWNDSTASVGKVGLNDGFELTFTPTDAVNYKTVTTTVSVTVSPKEIFLTDTNNIASMPYIANGYALSDIFAFAFSADGQNVSLTLGTDYTVTIKNASEETVSSFTTVDAYKVTVTLTNANYTLSADSQTEYTFNVTKAVLTLDGTVENNASQPYGGDFHNVAADYFKTGLTLKDADGNVIEGLGSTVIVGIYSDENCTIFATPENVGTYHVKYTFVNDNYTIVDVNNAPTTTVVKTIKINKATVEITTLPTFTDYYFLNQFNLQYYAPTTPGVVKVTEGQFKDTIVNGTWSYSAEFIASDPDASKLTCTFTMSSDDYKNYQFVNGTTVNLQSYSGTGTLKLRTVAVLGDSITKGTKYGSLEDALVNTEGTIWVMSYDDIYEYPKFITSEHYNDSIVLMSNATVASGVTLILPYDANGSRNSDGNAEDITTSSQNPTHAIGSPETYRKTLLIIADNVTLTIKGTLEVSGYLSGAGSGANYSGQTAGNYAEIILDGANAKIIGNGTIKSSGFITGTGTVDMVSGTLYLPFILRDFGGGSLMSAVKGVMNDKKLAPFSEWQLENIQSILIVRSGATLKIWGNLGATNGLGGDATNHHAEGTMIGDGAFIKLNSGSYLESRYNSATEVLTIDIYGGAVFSGFKLDIAGNDIDTSEVFFALNWSHDIRLHGDGKTYDASSLRFKLMFGTKLTVDEGVTLKVKELIVYDNYEEYLNKLNNPSRESRESRLLAYARTTLVYSSSDAKYHLGVDSLSSPRLQDAKLIVNGNLVAENLGGNVYSESDRARVEITGSPTCTANEIVKFSVLAFLSSIKQYQAVTRNATFYGYIKVEYIRDANGDLTEWDGKYDYVYNETTKLYEYKKPETLVRARFYDGTISEQFDSGVVMNSTGSMINSGIKWVYPSITIKYDAQGGTAIGNSTFDHVGNNAYSGTIGETTRGNYVFAGWYLDSGCTKPLRDSLIDGKFVNPTSNVVQLYAKWTYNISYEYLDPDGNVITQPDWIEDSDNLKSGGSSDSTVTLPNPRHDTYLFMGWYADAAGTVKIANGGDTVKESVISQHMGANGTIKLYGIWKGTVFTFKISDTNKHGYGYTGDYKDGTYTFTPADIEGKTLPIPTDTTEKVDKQYYFTGWNVSVNGGAATLVTNATTFAELLPNLDDSATVTLTAQWTEKVTVKVTITNVTDGNATNDTNANYTATFYNSSDKSIGTGSYNKAENGEQKYYLMLEQKFIFSVTSGGDHNLPTETITVEADKTYDYTINWVDGTKSNGCLVEGTLITMADGTLKLIEELRMDDEILILNHETGKYESGKVWFIVHGELPRENREILTLRFSDGTEIKIAHEHALFDSTLSKYVYLSTENATEYIGHEFLNSVLVNGEYVVSAVTLVEASVSVEYVKVYSPISEMYLNVVANGMLTATASLFDLNELVNIYDYDSEGKYVEEVRIADLEKHGEYTYEEFAHLFSKNEFDTCPLRYLKVGVEKGLITREDIETLIKTCVALGYMEAPNV